MDIMMGIVREDILITYFEITCSSAMNKKLTHQPKELVDQKCDIYEWRLSDEETVT